MTSVTSARLAKILAEARAKKDMFDKAKLADAINNGTHIAANGKTIDIPDSLKPYDSAKASTTSQREVVDSPSSGGMVTPTTPMKESPVPLSTQAVGMSRLEALRAKLSNRDKMDIQGTVTGRFKGGTSNIEEIDRHPLSKPEPSTETNTHVDKEGKLITYNSKQNEFVTLAESTAACVLIGAAGTGKTTCMQGALSALIQTGKIPVLRADGHKYLVDGTPGCVIIAYTRRATNNIRRVLPDDLKNNAITAHKLLEYKPEFFEVLDDEGRTKKTMRFLASRNQENPLPPSIHTIVVEESSMLSVEMYNEINLALQHTVQWIFLGDINQLPPVFGSAVLGFRLLDLPVVELTEVYRQALESPIIRLAHRILSGSVIKEPEFKDWFYKDELKLHAWKKKIGADDSLRTLAEFFKVAYDKEVYNIDEDIILIPYNKACGTLELNKHIANHIARKHQRTTYEIVAGFNRHYFSVGDKVLYDKEDAEIVEIGVNASYTGAGFKAESKHLDYWGHNPKAMEEYTANMAAEEQSEADVDFLLEAVATAGDDEDRVRKASHIITVRLTDTGQDVTIDTAADINNLLHAYALTIHKSQGSEWRKVYLCLHQSHATMMQRELLYTAVTRAKQELYVICEPDSFVKGIERQRIKGDTLKEKAEFFKGKLIDVPS